MMGLLCHTHGLFPALFFCLLHFNNALLDTYLRVFSFRGGDNSYSNGNGYSNGGGYGGGGYGGSGGYGGGYGGRGGGGGDRMSNLGSGLKKQDWGEFCHQLDLSGLL